MLNSGLISARIRSTYVTENAAALLQDPPASVFPTWPQGKQGISLEKRQLLVN